MKPEQFLKDFAVLRENRSYYDYRSNQPFVDRIDRKIEEITRSLIERDKKLLEAVALAIEVLEDDSSMIFTARKLRDVLKDIGEEI